MLLVLAMISCAFAQDEVIPPPRQSKVAKVGAVGGFTTGWLFLNAGPINQFLKAGNAAAVSGGGVFLKGGSGAAYIMIIKNFRVGGMGMSGSVSSSVYDAVTGVRRDANVKAGFGAVTLEYALTVLPRVDVIGGLALGTGGVDILLQKSNGTMSTWDTESAAMQGTPLTTTGNLSRTLTSSFFVWIPTVNVEYAFLGWVGARVGVSYLGMSSPSWTVDSQYSLLNVPSDVSGKGWMINLALIVGTL